MERLIDDILLATHASEMYVALSGENNFRYQVFPEYKANRLTMDRPQYLTQCKDYLEQQYNAVRSDGCEADDLLGIRQCEGIQQTIICSLDKDLRQIPGQHYSWEISGGVVGKNRWTKPAEFANVTREDGLKFFYYQLLIGDATDGLKGVSGIGKVKANRILDGLTTEQEMFEAVRDAYSNDEEMLMNGRCLWIFHKPNDIWEFPKFETTVE
jgi:DNA polymerase-1